MRRGGLPHQTRRMVADYLEVFVKKNPVAEADRRAGARDPYEARLADLQQRVRDGRYDNRGVMDQVARRILQRGDI